MSEREREREREREIRNNLHNGVVSSVMVYEDTYKNTYKDDKCSAAAAPSKMRARVSEEVCACAHAGLSEWGCALCRYLCHSVCGYI